jgi:tryptophan-rich sensory protein
MLPMTIYFVHLALNFFWSLIFFGLKRPGWAFCEILLLWSTLVATIIIFYPINQTAALILLPYLLWSSFAGCLNFAMWRLNKAPLSNPV